MRIRKGNASVSKLEVKKPFEFSDEKFLNSKRNFDFDSLTNGKNKNDENDLESIFSNTSRNTKPNKPPINMIQKNSLNKNNIMPLKNSGSSGFSKTPPNQMVAITPNKEDNADLILFNIGSETKMNNLNSNVIPAVNMIDTTENVISRNLRKNSYDNTAKNRQSSSNLLELNDGDYQNKNNIQSLFNHNFFLNPDSPNEQNVNQGLSFNNNNETFVTAVSKQPQINKNGSNTINNLENNMEMKVVKNVLNEVFNSNKCDISNFNNPNLFSNNSEMVNMFSNSSSFPMPNNFNNNNNFNLIQQNQMNRQSINFINNMNIPQQQSQSPIPIKTIPNMNLNNNDNFNKTSNLFNFYPNQMANNSQMFYQHNQMNVPIQGQMGPFVPYPNIISINPQNQSMMSNMNMENTIYDTDKLTRTINEIDKVYNNSNPNNFNNNSNYINNNMNTVQNNFNMNNMNYPQINQVVNPNNVNMMINSNAQMPMNNMAPINYINLNEKYKNQMVNNNNINDIHVRSNSIYQNMIRNTQDFNNNYLNYNNNSPVNMPNKKITNNSINPKENTNQNQKFNVNSNSPKLNKKPQTNIQNNNNDNNSYKFNFNTNNNDNNQNNLDENNFESEEHNSGNGQFKTDVSNINIINIETHINNISLHKEEEDLEKIANKFLFEQLSKASLHWLISSKDIEIDKRIGFGGTSDVFKGNYRGTDVAVKKLKFLEVQEENLKEFKREVSSLIMLRHPNLVLFMGAM